MQKRGICFISCIVTGLQRTQSFCINRFQVSYTILLTQFSALNARALEFSDVAINSGSSKANSFIPALTDLYICICKLIYYFIYLSPCILFISSLKCPQVSFSVLQRHGSVSFNRTYSNIQLFFSLYPLICHQLMLGFSCMTSRG